MAGVGVCVVLVSASIKLLNIQTVLEISRKERYTLEWQSGDGSRHTR